MIACNKVETSGAVCFSAPRALSNYAPGKTPNFSHIRVCTHRRKLANLFVLLKWAFCSRVFIICKCGY